MNDPLFDILNVVAVIELIEENSNITEDLINFISIEGSKWLSSPENKDHFRVSSELKRLINYCKYNKRLKHITLDFAYSDDVVIFYVNGKQKGYIAYFKLQSRLELQSRYTSWKTGE